LKVANKWDERKKTKEDEYFVKKEHELLAKLKARQERDAKAAKQKASAMTCPECDEPLKKRSFQKIATDQCKDCGGIWLDAGELKKIAKKENNSWLGKFWKKNG